MFFFHQSFSPSSSAYLKCTRYIPIYCFKVEQVENFCSGALFRVFNLGTSKVEREKEKRLRETLNKCYWRRTRFAFLFFLGLLKREASHSWHSVRFLFVVVVVVLFLWQSHPLSTDLTVSGLGMVHVTIPTAIQSGRNAIMTCDYELEDDDLYSVKWYKGKREFFRFTPKEIPSIKLFKFPGIRVDVSWCSLLIPPAPPSFPNNIFYHEMEGVCGQHK